MISKNIIKNYYTHRVVESDQKDSIEIGSRELIIPKEDPINSIKFNTNFHEVRIPSELIKPGKVFSTINPNIILILASILLSGLVLYSLTEQILLGKILGKNPISNEALLSIGFYFLLLSFTLPFIFLKKKFVLKIRKSYLDINYSLNRIQRIDLDSVNECRVLNKSEDATIKWIDLDLSTKRKSYRTNINSSIAVFLKDGRCLLFGADK